MHTLSILCLVILVGFSGQTKKISSRLITKNGKNASGGEVSVTESIIVIEEKRGGPPAEQEASVEKEGSQLGKRFVRYKREVPRKVECASMKPPDNGKVVCYWKNIEPEAGRICSAICIRNYKFPDGSAVKTFNCTWQVGFWNHIDQPQDCQPAKPGIGCDKRIEGQNQLQICRISPEKMKCKSMCNSGHKFPDGETRMEMLCDKRTGVYEPIDKFPDCVKSGDGGIEKAGEIEREETYEKEE